jgi:hypothetical protein
MCKYDMSPRCMQAGGIVVVLLGGNTPYVLRLQDDKYLFMDRSTSMTANGNSVRDVKA